MLEQIAGRRLATTLMEVVRMLIAAWVRHAMTEALEMDTPVCVPIRATSEIPLPISQLLAQREAVAARLRY
jgi:hypothetical protein